VGLAFVKVKLGARLRGWIGALRIGSGVARLILGPGIGLFVGHWLS